MTRDEVIAKLKRMRPMLDEFNVKSVAVFGSVARNEATPKSDVDILVEFTKTPGLFEFVALKRKLTSRLHRRVDLATPNMIRPSMKERVFGDAVYAYS